MSRRQVLFEAGAGEQCDAEINRLDALALHRSFDAMAAARIACSGAGIAAGSGLFAASFVEKAEPLRVLPEWDLPSVTAWAVFPGRRLMPAKTHAFFDMMAVLCCEDAGKRLA